MHYNKEISITIDFFVVPLFYNICQYSNLHGSYWWSSGVVMSDTSSTAGGAVELMLSRQELYSRQIDKNMPCEVKSMLSLSFYHLFTLTVCLHFTSLSSLVDMWTPKQVMHKTLQLS